MRNKKTYWIYKNQYIFLNEGNKNGFKYSCHIETAYFSGETLYSDTLSGMKKLIKNKI